MKKTIAILLSFGMILGLTACGSSAGQGESSSVEDTVVESSTENSAQPESSDMQDGSGVAEDTENNAGNETQSAENGTEDEAETQQPNAGNSEAQSSRVLVAYFSATNTTKGVAEHIADGLDADLYEIVPEEPYTDADLNYNDNSSRSTIEMNDPSARPAISGSVENMEQYDIVFIGYPIWWGEAPRILATFVESYDFSGKTVVPFCTSGGSGVGSSATNLEQLTSGATWLDGRRLNGSDSQDTVMEWVNGLGLNFSN